MSVQTITHVFDCHHTGVGRRVFTDQNQMLHYIGEHELTICVDFHISYKRATPRKIELAEELRGECG